MNTRLSPFQIALLVIAIVLVLFVSIPLLANSGVLPSTDISLGEDTTIVDPTEEFESLSNIEQGAFSGMLRSDKVYQTIHARNIEQCDTYTITEELELVDEDNGLHEGSANYEIETYEPTAITCTVNSDNIEDRDENVEVVVEILDYDKSTGKYTQVDSVEEIK